jgi:hypothetical protein
MIPRQFLALPVPLLAAALAVTGPAQSQTPPPNLRAVPFPQVTVADPFFAPRRATNLRVTLEHSLKQLEATGTLANFDLAAQGARTGFNGYVFQDSDAYKALEAIALALAATPDPGLDARADAVIARIAASQRPDGYLNSWYSVNAPERRFANLRDDHELYCAGHLFEAAAAHFQATGKRSLLDIATKYADLLCRTFGPGEGRRPGYCGHPEIELALVKLADVTRKQDYFELARWFVEQRGSRFFAQEHRTDPARYDGTYWLDHVPVAAMDAIAGHAVRATYLMSGVVDTAARSGNQDLLRMARRVFRNTIERNVFVTGGIGPSASNEGFTRDYDLPTHTAYQETCASIAMAMWAQRMCLFHGDARYADAMETALYNAVPAGVQLDGTKFFYVNPLSSRGHHHRREWYGCACCPPNVARTLAAIGGYAYATGPDSLSVNLYVQGKVAAEVAGEPFELEVTTEYPWDGKVAIRVVKAPAAAAALCLRQPGFAPQMRVQIGGSDAEQTLARGYVVLRRTWRAGDVVDVEIPMAVRRLEADPRAETLAGRVAFARGPIVYCGEQVDQAVPVDSVFAPPGAVATVKHDPELLGGVTTLEVAARTAERAPWPARQLYCPQPETQPETLKLVPYAVWDNRTAGGMHVWWPQTPPVPAVGGPELAARVEISFQNRNCDPEGVRDGEEPKRSGDTPPRNCHWWDHKGTTEWVQYTWTEPQALAGARVYWFDDTGHGACRLPAAARLLWRDGDAWRPVEVQGAPLPIAADRWCEVKFAPVQTTALRLECDLQKDWAAGVLEWRLVEADVDR